MCLPKPIKEEVKKKNDLRHHNALIALQLMKIFVNMFVYVNLIHYWSFVNGGIDLGLSEEDWILSFLGPNGEVPYLYRAFSNTGYTSSEDDDDTTS